MSFNPLLVLSTVLLLISPFLYARSIIKGEAKPHRTTRLVILVITALALATLWSNHDQTAIWLAAVGTLQSTIVFGLSLKYGMGGWSKLDLACLVIAVLGIGIWQLTRNPVLGLYAAIAADFTGFFPTIVKTYRLPHTETLNYFLLNCLACGLNLVSVKVWTLQNIAYPFYLTAVGLVMVFLILKPKLASR